MRHTVRTQLAHRQQVKDKRVLKEQPANQMAHSSTAANHKPVTKLKENDLPGKCHIGKEGPPNVTVSDIIKKEAEDRKAESGTLTVVTPQAPGTAHPPPVSSMLIPITALPLAQSGHGAATGQMAPLATPGQITSGQMVPLVAPGPMMSGQMAPVVAPGQMAPGQVTPVVAPGQVAHLVAPGQFAPGQIAPGHMPVVEWVKMEHGLQSVVKLEGGVLTAHIQPQAAGQPLGHQHFQVQFQVTPPTSQSVVSSSNSRATVIQHTPEAKDSTVQPNPLPTSLPHMFVAPPHMLQIAHTTSQSVRPNAQTADYVQAGPAHVNHPRLVPAHSTNPRAPHHALPPHMPPPHIPHHAAPPTPAPAHLKRQYPFNSPDVRCVPGQRLPPVAHHHHMPHPEPRKQARLDHSLRMQSHQMAPPIDKGAPAHLTNRKDNVCAGSVSSVEEAPLDLCTHARANNPSASTPPTNSIPAHNQPPVIVMPPGVSTMQPMSSAHGQPPIMVLPPGTMMMAPRLPGHRLPLPPPGGMIPPAHSKDRTPPPANNIKVSENIFI